jgi:hypothetical protein
MQCSICQKILKESLDQKDIFKIEGHYEYKNKTYCVNCWDKQKTIFLKPKKTEGDLK